MKKIKISILIASLMVVGQLSAKKEIKTTRKSDKATVEYSVNMECKDCENRITEQLRFEKGVTDLKTELNKEKVTVTYKSGKTDTSKIANSIRKLGFIVSNYKK